MRSHSRLPITLLFRGDLSTSHLLRKFTIVQYLFSEHFSVRKIKYPSNKESMIAPGMSIVMYISFFAPSFADFNDVLTIVTEENSFEIPIVARRDPPVIKLVNPMDSKACWLGRCRFDLWSYPIFR